MNAPACFRPFIGIVRNKRGGYALRIHRNPDTYRDVGNYPTFADALRRAAHSGYTIKEESFV